MASNLPPITIIGAGLSGLTLGLCLKHKGISATIYDRASSPPRYSYGIVLHSATYRPLLRMLCMNETTFRTRTAVDSQQGVTGSFPNTGASVAKSTDSFRCHRGRLEELLREDLAIRWDKALKDVEVDSQSRNLSAIFEDGDQHATKCLIGCDGPHSRTRQSLSSALKLQVLPYVVFNGKRSVSLDEFIEKIYKHLGENSTVQTRKGDVLLALSVNEIKGSEVRLSYTYSRPAREGYDPLHKPDHPISGATDIAEEFFTELAGLSELQSPFVEILNVEEVRQDRLLHWLMRTVSPNLSEINRLADLDVALIGDAAHATPILGGEGANFAIQDGIDLAEYLAASKTVDLKDFSKAKLETWQKLVEESQERVRNMHTPKASHI